MADFTKNWEDAVGDSSRTTASIEEINSILEEVLPVLARKPAGDPTNLLLNEAVQQAAGLANPGFLGPTFLAGVGSAFEQCNTNSLIGPSFAPLSPQVNTDNFINSTSAFPSRDTLFDLVIGKYIFELFLV